MANAAVIGGGSFGTCLAKHLADNGHNVRLWCRSRELASELTQTRENPKYLPGFKLPESVEITAEIESATSGCDLIVGVTPSTAIQEIFCPIAGSLGNAIMVNASKGLDPETLEPIDRIYKRIFPQETFRRAVYLSGPTFAKEIAANMPSAAVMAGRDETTVQRMQEIFSGPSFRAYRSDDVTGVLMGGALKNIVAIAAGVSDGLGLGHNSRAALITRGLAEISRIGVALGADPLTFSGLSGLGDLVLTCSGDLSRNRQVGLALGAGKSLEQIQADMKMIAEGVKTTKVAVALAKRVDVDAPIANAMHSLLFEDVSPQAALMSLMSRSLKHERF